MRVGTSSESGTKSRMAKDHPHACGDKWLGPNLNFKSYGSSPCVWGQELEMCGKRYFFRIIPMRVGTS